ncbi:MAG: lamin tail domain-containing protein [Chloroflexi bacterium]|nr:lamin tail domain-containing protein [Chloroflexota bacterium]
MADNQGILEDPTRPGEFPDWIELYNFGPITVSLDSLYLTDDRDKPTRFPIPVGLSIPPNQYLIFFADGTPEQGAQHTNFKLNRSGDFVGLYGAQGSFAIDSQAVGEQFPNLSFGRYPDGNGAWQILFCPTPSTINRDCANRLNLPLIGR